MKMILTEKEASEYICMSTSYLRQDRMNRTIANRTPGPSYIKLGRSIRYHLDDLNQWLEKRKVTRL